MENTGIEYIGNTGLENMGNPGLEYTGNTGQECMEKTDLEYKGKYWCGNIFRKHACVPIVSKRLKSNL